MTHPIGQKINYFINLYVYKTRLPRYLVEDFVMEAYTRFYEKNPEDDNLNAWFHVTIKHIIIDYYRSESRQMYAYTYEDSNVDYDLINNEVDLLPDNLKIYIKLHYFEGFKYREIAEILNVPMQKVKNQIHQAKLKLKIKLDAVYT